MTCPFYCHFARPVARGCYGIHSKGLSVINSIILYHMTNRAVQRCFKMAWYL